MTVAPSVVTQRTVDPDSTEHGAITLAGGLVVFEVRGHDDHAIPVLLLRPLAGSMALWGEFRDVIATTFRVVAFDPLGVGSSSSAALDVGTRTMARDTLGVLDALGVARAHVFGISLGAMVAMWLAIDAPERVARLCLASAGPTGFVLPRSAVSTGVAMVEAVLSPEHEVVSRLVEAVLSQGVCANEPAMVRTIETATADDPARRVEILKHIVAAVRHDAKAELHRIQAPTLVLAGDHDELIGADPPVALASAIRGARLEIIVDAGHDITLEQPVATAQRVVDFFRETYPS